MKETKKWMGLCFAAIMVLSLALPFAAAKAAGSYTVTINGKTAGNTYAAYQVLSGTVEESDNKRVLKDDVTWTPKLSNDEISSFLKELKENTKFAELFKDTTDALSFKKVVESSAFSALSTDELTAFSEIVAKHFAVAKNLSGTSTPGAHDSTTYTITDLDGGYYLIKDKDDKTALAKTKYIMDVVGNINVQTKVGDTSLEKTVSNTQEGEYNKAVSTNVSDPVYFKLKATLPEFIHTYKSYKLTFHDTMQKGLTYDCKDQEPATGVVSARILRNEETETIPISSSDYTVKYTENEDGTTNITIATKDLTGYNLKYGDEVEFIYRAKLNDDAVIGGEGNLNEVKLNYTNDPYADPEDEPQGETPKDKAKVFTYKVNATKVDKDNHDKTLEGATFLLYRKVEENGTTTIYYADKVENGKVVSWKSEEEYASEVKNEETGETKTPEEDALKLVSDENGKFWVAGLAHGTYYLKEVRAPEGGYNLTNKDIEFQISQTFDENTGELKNLEMVVDGETQVAQGGETSSGEVDMTVENAKGSNLPSTGGMGTRIFYILGGIFVFVAVVLLVTKKRMGVER